MKLLVALLFILAPFSAWGQVVPLRWADCVPLERELNECRRDRQERFLQGETFTEKELVCSLEMRAHSDCLSMLNYIQGVSLSAPLVCGDEISEFRGCIMGDPMRRMTAEELDRKLPYCMQYQEAMNSCLAENVWTDSWRANEMPAVVGGVARCQNPELFAVTRGFAEANPNYSCWELRYFWQYNRGLFGLRYTEVPVSDIDLLRASGITPEKARFLVRHFTDETYQRFFCGGRWVGSRRYRNLCGPNAVIPLYWQVARGASDEVALAIVIARAKREMAGFVAEYDIERSRVSPSFPRGGIRGRHRPMPGFSWQCSTQYQAPFISNLSRIILGIPGVGDVVERVGYFFGEVGGFLGFDIDGQEFLDDARGLIPMEWPRVVPDALWPVGVVGNQLVNAFGEVVGWIDVDMSSARPRWYLRNAGLRYVFRLDGVAIGFWRTESITGYLRAGATGNFLRIEGCPLTDFRSMLRHVPVQDRVAEAVPGRRLRRARARGVDAGDGVVRLRSDTCAVERVSADACRERELRRQHPGVEVTMDNHIYVQQATDFSACYAYNEAWDDCMMEVWRAAQPGGHDPCVACRMFELAFNTISRIAFDFYNDITRFGFHFLAAVLVLWMMWQYFVVFLRDNKPGIDFFKTSISKYMWLILISGLLSVSITNRFNIFSYTLVPITTFMSDFVEHTTNMLDIGDGQNECRYERLVSANAERPEGMLFPRQVRINIVCSIERIASFNHLNSLTGRLAVRSGWRHIIWGDPGGGLARILLGVGIVALFFFISIAIPFYFIESIFRMGIVVLLMPLFLGAWVFEKTKGLATMAWGMFFSAVMQVVFLSLMCVVIMLLFLYVIGADLHTIHAAFAAGDEGAVTSHIIYLLSFRPANLLEIFYVGLLAWYLIGKAVDYGSKFGQGNSIKDVAKKFVNWQKSAVLYFASAVKDKALFVNTANSLENRARERKEERGP